MNRITAGEWYQRTTLHLSEVYQFLELGTSNLKLSQEKLKELRSALNIKGVSRETGYFEYVKMLAEGDIEVRYYEDGLYVAEVASENIKNGEALVKKYFIEKLNPAISYLFSLGAPTPKVLASIQPKHPVIISMELESPEQYRVDETSFGEVYGKIFANEMAVYKTPDYIFIASKPGKKEKLSAMVEMQIFFREFKDQLERYLKIHRALWEEISAIKERKNIAGMEVELLRAKLDGYQKTVSLIGNRINQMQSYARTRSSIAKGLEIEDYLKALFQYKFEVLLDTLDYIKELWRMTGDYLNSAIQNMIEIKNQSASRSIQSLQLITSVGVVSGLIGYLTKSELPQLTSKGALYFVVIVLVTWALNSTINRIYARKRYTLKFGDRGEIEN